MGLLYENDYWGFKKQYALKMIIVEVRIYRWMSGNTWKDRIRNEVIHSNVRLVLKERCGKFALEGLVMHSRD